MFLSRIFSSLSPYQGQKLCFLTFLNIKSDFSRPYFIKPDCCPQSRGFYGDFFCSLQRKYRAALCITKCSYPRLLLSWGSYAVKNSALIFLLSYSLVTHLLLIQRFLTYFSTIPYKMVTSALFLFCFLTLRQAEVLTEKILSIFLFFCLQRAFPSIQRFLPYQFPVKFFCKRRFLPQKTAFAPLPCCLS